MMFVSLFSLILAVKLLVSRRIDGRVFEYKDYIIPGEGLFLQPFRQLPCIIPFYRVMLGLGAHALYSVSW